ncbi:MAG TPA: alpha-glucan family phosphorylase [Phycisphaerae bacterium]|nr:alpha-glucan family phosphorylase [Phycisphaerae bacterium]
MYTVKEFMVVPAIPEPLAGLRRLADNLWWTWNYDAVQLFNRLDRRLWSAVQHNPVRLLADIPQEKLERAAQDPAYLAHMDRVLEALDDYLGEKTWFASKYGELADSRIAYFSMEFGLHECLPIYSGGLGVLAGDHMKSASDLGLPLVGVGLLYHQGYFQQFLSNDGWQFEDYPTLDVHHLPVELVRDEKGNPVTVTLPVGERDVTVQVMRVIVGRVQLYLLDTVLGANHPDDRAITMRLYGGDQEMRIRQEVVLGFGGLRALRAMGISPVVCHMNEGHSAFLALEQVRHLVRTEKLTPTEARTAVAGSTIFTTHTPVPAGIDTFPQALVTKYLTPYAGEMKCTIDELIHLGQTHPGSAEEPFSMATLALNLSRMSNGVSRRHGEVAREMWQSNWEQVPVEEIPITSVTNGIHVRSWISSDVEQLLDRYLGPEWASNPDDSQLWARITEIPDAELWRAHERRRERLVVETRAHLKAQCQRRGAPPAQVAEAEEVLNPEALTIGFARRFAPYKRATLLLRDEARLLKLLTNPDRPIQFIFAGKAHPRDNMGKELVKQLIQFARRTDVRKRFVFLENYNMSIARFLVQGVDVWMNNPTKPLEASGTSGMKVVPNGGINFSVLDGWWCEGYDGTNGWAIGDDRVYDNADYQDFVESESIYDLLEREIIPEYYERSSDGLPRKWIARMKSSMSTCTPRFSSRRMVREYCERLYIPTVRNGLHLREQTFAVAKSLSSWRTALLDRWSGVKVESFAALENGERRVGAQLNVQATVVLGHVDPQDVAVQLYHGPSPNNGTIKSGSVVEMQCAGKVRDGVFTFTGAVPCERSGRQALAVRVVPSHPDLAGHFDMHMLKWG